MSPPLVLNRVTAKNATNISRQPKLGLVLSGGGAMGAYQVGVLRAIHDLGVKVDMVAGASIGALNGAVVSSAPNLLTAAQQLEALWIELGKESPLHPNIPAWPRLLLSAGMQPSALLTLCGLSVAFPGLGTLASLAQFTSNKASVFSDGPVHRLLDRYLRDDALAAGLPFFVSAFRSSGGFADLMQGLRAVAGFSTPRSEFFHIQGLPSNERRNAILASAALPMLFPSQKIGGQRYVDGGIGDAFLSGGNTPAKPLLDAGCTHLIVVHLSEASLFDRADCGDATVIEVAFQERIGKGGLMDLLSFDEKKARFLIQRGHEDGLASIGRIQALLALTASASAAASARQASLDRVAKAMEVLTDDEFDRHFR